MHPWRPRRCGFCSGCAQMGGGASPMSTGPWPTPITGSPKRNSRPSGETPPYLSGGSLASRDCGNHTNPTIESRFTSMTWRSSYPANHSRMSSVETRQGVRSCCEMRPCGSGPRCKRFSMSCKKIAMMSPSESPIAPSETAARAPNYLKKLPKFRIPPWAFEHQLTQVHEGDAQ